MRGETDTRPRIVIAGVEVRLQRGGGAAVRGTDLSLFAGKVTALLGPSGAGKSTLLRAIAGLERLHAGEIRSDGSVWSGPGTHLPPEARRCGVVFQDFALFPHLTAAQNVGFGLRHLARSERKARVADALRAVELSHRAHAYPHELSGGEQQRVALARALARKPQALLLDEPFSAVDRATREKLHAEIIALRAHLAMPVVLVTHDMNEAQLLADRMVVIERGRVVHEGTTAQVMADPEALRAMGIREVAVMLPAVITGHGADGLTRLDTEAGPLFLPGVAGRPGTRIRVRIMAHEVILSRGRPEGLSAQNILAGTVAKIVQGKGPAVTVHVNVGSHEILARITRRAAGQMALQPGDPVHAILKSMSVARDHVQRLST